MVQGQRQSDRHIRWGSRRVKSKGVHYSLHEWPWTARSDLAPDALEWVARYDTQRLLAPLSYLPPVEHEEQFHRTRTAPVAAGALR